MKVLAATVLSLGVAASASAAMTSVTKHGAGATDLAYLIPSQDLISGMIGTELAGDQGWHPAIAGNPALQLPVFTNDANDTGLAGLLNDFPPVGAPAKIVQYDLAAATDITSLGIMTGNNGADGRVFSTTVIKVSTDNGANFSDLGYFQSDPSGTVNGGQWQSTYVSIYDDQKGVLAAGVTNIIFELYGVDNTLDEMRDPFDGVNPYTGIDDTYSAPNTSPLVWELDVVPEPASMALLGLGGLALIRRR